MGDRSANRSIRGYVYQFDECILRLLNSKPNESVLFEGIEDVDIESGNSCEAIQCKYHPSKTYSLASIRDPILPMLEDFLKRIRQGRQEIRYRLFAYFSDINPGDISLDLQSIKKCLLKIVRKGDTIDYQKVFGATDKDLEKFLKILSIEIATEYSCHKDEVFSIIKQEYSCDDEEIEFYYNNALSLVAQMSSETEESKRRITKRQFLKKTNTKQIFYSIWHLQEIGKANYCREIRRQHFSIINIPAYVRIFIIELEGNESQVAIKEAVLELERKWSSHRIRIKPAQDRYAPYILLNGIKPPQLIKLKSKLHEEGFKFTDGFPYMGSDLKLDELNKPQTYENQLSLRFINEPESIPKVIKSLSHKTKEIYQFYRNKPIVISDDLKNIQIKIKDVTYVKEMI